MQENIIIIGAGLTGLTLAYLLKKRNINALVLEANDRIGGRIQTVNGINNTKIEIGATWFNKQHLHVINLMHELNLTYFKQFTKGVSLFETDVSSPPQKFEIPSDEEQSSYRIVDGTFKLIKTLANQLDKDQIRLNKKIVKITENKSEIIVTLDNAETYVAKKVVATLPPNLLINTIEFSPSFSKEAVDIFNRTHTWMGESIKFSVEYAQPFWKEKGYSGTLFSHANIIQEQYDHSAFDDRSFALMGFLNGSSAHMPKIERKKMIVSQLCNLLGEEANNYLKYYEKVWQFDRFTFIPYQNYLLAHQNNGNPIFKHAFMHDKLILSGTETSSKFGGYMDGAISTATFINLIIELYT